MQSAEPRSVFGGEGEGRRGCMAGEISRVEGKGVKWRGGMGEAKLEEERKWGE